MVEYIVVRCLFFRTSEGDKVYRLHISACLLLIFFFGCIDWAARAFKAAVTSPDFLQAMKNEIEHYGEGLYACVMDSYDYDNALDNVLPK